MNLTITMPRNLAHAAIQFMPENPEEYTPDPELNAFFQAVWLETCRSQAQTWANYTVLALSFPQASSLYFVEFLSSPAVYLEFQTDLLNRPHEVGLLFLAVLFNRLAEALDNPSRLELPEAAYIPSHIETVVGKLKLSLVSNHDKAH
jgi:hypothetical protein